MKFYLTGAITHDSEANGWRDYVISEVPNHEFINPMTDDGCETKWQTILNARRQHADACKEAIGQYERCLDFVRMIMRERFMPRDFKWIDECDGVICCVKRGSRIYGSACEMQRARDQGKVVILVSELKFMEMNDWEIALTDRVFVTLEEMIEWLKELSDDDILFECQEARNRIERGLVVYDRVG